MAVTEETSYTDLTDAEIEEVRWYAAGGSILKRHEPDDVSIVHPVNCDRVLLMRHVTGIPRSAHAARTSQSMVSAVPRSARELRAYGSHEETW